VFEPRIRPVTMNDNQRRDFVRKAKADSLAYESAQLLSKGETSEAASLAGQCMSLAGPEQFTLWLRHYATTRFKLPTLTVEKFLSSMPPADVAL
jgi:hypothetical protein